MFRGVHLSDQAGPELAVQRNRLRYMTPAEAALAVVCVGIAVSESVETVDAAFGVVQQWPVSKKTAAFAGKRQDFVGTLSAFEPQTASSRPPVPEHQEVRAERAEADWCEQVHLASAEVLGKERALIQHHWLLLGRTPHLDAVGNPTLGLQ